MIPIRTDAQRQWIERVSQTVSKGHSLIPSDKTYRSHLWTYQRTLSSLGFHRSHGLRHAYAQQRYQTLTASFDDKKKGLIAPIAGGKSADALSVMEKDWDRRARAIIARELGHSRLSITKIYCG